MWVAHYHWSYDHISYMHAIWLMFNCIRVLTWFFLIFWQQQHVKPRKLIQLWEMLTQFWKNIFLFKSSHRKNDSIVYLIEKRECPTEVMPRKAYIWSRNWCNFTTIYLVFSFFFFITKPGVWPEKKKNRSIEVIQDRKRIKK